MFMKILKLLKKVVADKAWEKLLTGKSDNNVNKLVIIIIEEKNQELHICSFLFIKDLKLKRR